MATCAWLNNNGEIITCIEADAFPTIVGNIIDGEVIYKETCVDPLLKKAQEMYDSCKQCFAYPFCKGGCPAKAIAKEQLNDDREMSWDCEMTVKFWKYLLNELVLGRESFGWKTENSRYHALSEIGVLECVPIKEKKRMF
jgi:radical SAM protein with 4Fe4S-binding SPASM domain